MDPAVRVIWRAINAPISRTLSYFEAAGGDWEVFSKTYGWFQVKDKLTAEQQAEVERLFRESGEVVYGVKPKAQE